MPQRWTTRPFSRGRLVQTRRLCPRRRRRVVPDAVPASPHSNRLRTPGSGTDSTVPAPERVIRAPGSLRFFGEFARLTRQVEVEATADTEHQVTGWKFIETWEVAQIEAQKVIGTGWDLVSQRKWIKATGRKISFSVRSPTFKINSADEISDSIKSTRIFTELPLFRASGPEQALRSQGWSILFQGIANSPGLEPHNSDHSASRRSRHCPIYRGSDGFC